MGGLQWQPKLVLDFRAHSAPIRSVALAAPDLLVTAAAACDVCLWRISTGACVGVFGQQQSWPSAIPINPRDGAASPPFSLTPPPSRPGSGESQSVGTAELERPVSQLDRPRTRIDTSRPSTRESTASTSRPSTRGSPASTVFTHVASPGQVQPWYPALCVLSGSRE
jgi:hypothetical protein